MQPPTPGLHWHPPYCPYLAFLMLSGAREYPDDSCILASVTYGEKGRINGWSLIGGAGDAHHGPIWIDPFGNKPGEAAQDGFARLSFALAHGPQEQVSFPLQPPLGNPGACCKLWCVFSEKNLGSGGSASSAELRAVG